MNDLYDRLRPTDEQLDADTADRVWARITGEQSPTAPTLTALAAIEFDRSPEVPPHRRRRPAIWASAAAVLVGIGGVAAITTTRADMTRSTLAPADSTTPVASSSVAETPTSVVSTSQAPNTEAITPPTEVDLSSGTNFAVTDHVPEGWHVAMMRAEPAGSILGAQRWAQLGPDGSVTGILQVRPPFPVDDAEADEHNTTVRGLPAMEWSNEPGDDGSEGRTGISWIEDSFQLQVSATGTAIDLVRPVAEAIAFDTADGAASLPNEFGLIAEHDLEFAEHNAVNTTIGLRPDWSDSHDVGVIAEPNTFGRDLEYLVGPRGDVESVPFDELAAMTHRSHDGGLIGMSWLDGGMFVTIQATLALSDEEMFAIARGVRFTDDAEFQEVGRSVADESIAEVANWAVFDRMVTADGIGISIRSKPGGSGANALCIDAPVFDCTRLASEAAMVDGFATDGAAGFNLGTRQIGIAWLSNEIDAITGDPTVGPSTSLRHPRDLYRTDTTATVTDDVITDVGRFVVVDIPAGEHAPAIRFERLNYPNYELELTPFVKSQFEF